MTKAELVLAFAIGSTGFAIVSPKILGHVTNKVVDGYSQERAYDAVVLIDTLEAVPAPLVRRLLASARNLVDGGSLTVIGTRSEPVGGETTVVALDAALARAGRFPSLDPEASWTMRAEVLGAAAG